MVYTPTYVFTPFTLAQASQVNQNFAELDSYFLLLTGGTLVGDLLFDDGFSNIVVSVDHLLGRVTMRELALTPLTATPAATPVEGLIYYNDNDDLIYYYNGTAWV